MPSPDEQAAGGEDVAIDPGGEVCRAAADVEIDKQGFGVAAGERSAAPLEGEPRLETGIVGGGDERRPEALADRRHEPACILPSRGEPGEECASAADVGVAGNDAATGEPTVDETEDRGEIEPITIERREHQRRAERLAGDRQLHPPRDGVTSHQALGHQRA